MDRRPEKAAIDIHHQAGILKKIREHLVESQGLPYIPLGLRMMHRNHAVKRWMTVVPYHHVSVGFEMPPILIRDPLAAVRLYGMAKNRLEAFSDGVIAIIITIMVLELKVPHNTSFAALRPVLPVFLSYLLSFLYVGIYWNNHHHLLHTTRSVSAGVLWANLYLLFWLSLFPFATAWVGENHSAPAPAVAYGFVLMMAAIAYYILQRAIISHQGQRSLLASALARDWKGKLSPVIYLAAIPLAFVNPWIANGLYIFGALLWLIPDRRIERALEKAALN